jgi:hypothetical protein
VGRSGVGPSGVGRNGVDPNVVDPNVVDLSGVDLSVVGRSGVGRSGVDPSGVGRSGVDPSGVGGHLRVVGDRRVGVHCRDRAGEESTRVAPGRYQMIRGAVRFRVAADDRLTDR